MDIMVTTYATYLIVSVAMTVWVARTLTRHGQPFLLDVFNGNNEMASAVNHLLAVGFYLINFGYISLALKLGYDVDTLRTSIEALSSKIGYVLVILGGMHFFNLFIFNSIRSRCGNKPPVMPDEYTEIC